MSNAAAALFDELLQFWRSQPTARKDAVPPAIDRSLMYDAAVPVPARTTSALDLGTELGERLVSEILNGVRAGRQGVFVSEPERLRTAIFIRGHRLKDFARLAGIAPSTLSRALAGQPIAPDSWRALITTLGNL